MATMNDGAIEQVQELHDQAVRKAFDALAGYKFQMFGYWAATSVHYSQLIGKLGGKRPASSFRQLVHCARAAQEAEAERPIECICGWLPGVPEEDHLGACPERHSLEAIRLQDQNTPEAITRTD